MERIAGKVVPSDCDNPKRTSSHACMRIRSDHVQFISVRATGEAAPELVIFHLLAANCIHHASQHRRLIVYVQAVASVVAPATQIALRSLQGHTCPKL